MFSHSVYSAKIKGILQSLWTSGHICSYEFKIFFYFRRWDTELSCCFFFGRKTETVLGIVYNIQF